MASVLDIERENNIIITYKNGEMIKETFAEHAKRILNAKKEAKKANKASKAKYGASVNYTNFTKEFVIKKVKKLKVLKSLETFYNHAYRSWGVITREITEHPYLKDNFIHYIKVWNDVNALLDTIDSINDKDVYQFIEKLGYKMDDITKAINKLTEGIEYSKVCETFADTKMIKSEGRELGLSIIMQKCLLAVFETQQMIKEFDELASKGADITEYHTHGSFTRL